MPGGNFVQFTDLFLDARFIRTAARGRYTEAMHAGTPNIDRSDACWNAPAARFGQAYATVVLNEVHQGQNQPRLGISPHS